MSSDLQEFAFAAATLTGGAHLRAGRNNQDAFALRRTGAGFAVVVCDGCSAGERSEVGAQLGADLLCAALSERLEAADLEAAAQEAVEDVLRQLGGLATAMGAGREHFVEQRLLFTVVAAVANAVDTVVLAFGDGLVSLNGRTERLGPFPDNAPPYVCYRLLGAQVEPTLLWRLPTAELRSLVLATDGVADLPGEEPAALLSDHDLFLNRDALRRRLFRARRAGLLRDDAAAAVVRRLERA